MNTGSNQLLDYILLAVILALAIHFGCRFLGRENFHNTPKDGADVRKCTKKHKIRNGYASGKADDFYETTDEEYYASNILDRNVGTHVEHMADMTPLDLNENRNCTICKTEGSVADYIREDLLASARACQPKRHFTKEEIEQGNNDFFSFRNKVWQTADGGDDLVDRINYMYLSGSEDIARNNKGMKIKDLFDGLLKQENLYDKDCVRVPDIPGVTEVGQNKKSGYNGEYYTKDDWVYTNEKTINGGAFYNGVYAADIESAYQQAV